MYYVGYIILVFSNTFSIVYNDDLKLAMHADELADWNQVTFEGELGSQRGLGFDSLPEKIDDVAYVALG